MPVVTPTRGRVRTLLPLKHVTFRPGQLGDDLMDRHENAGQAARTAATRYLWLVRRARTTLHLSPDEVQVLVTVLRGYELTDSNLGLVWAKVEAELNATGLAALHGVDPERLVDTVRGYSPVQTVALVDAVEVFWRAGADAAALERSGLVAA